MSNTKVLTDNKLIEEDIVLYMKKWGVTHDTAEKCIKKRNKDKVIPSEIDCIKL